MLVEEEKGCLLASGTTAAHRAVPEGAPESKPTARGAEAHS